MKNKNISEKELDKLLNQSFLGLDFNNPKNNQIAESLAEQTLSPKIMPSVAKKFFLNKIFLLLTIIGVVLVSAFYFTTNNTTSENQLTSVVPLVTNKDSNQVVIQQTQLDTTVTNDKPFIDKEVNQVETYIPTETENNLDTLTEVVVYHEPITVKSEKREVFAYVFPKLSEKEIKETVKEKKKIVKLASKLSKERYALILGKGFYMQTAEVTNLEYRTFLFDLLIQGRNDEFLKAKPEQQLWLNAAGLNKFDSYKDVYFSDSKFNYFPVVNISQEGAELYCKWLSELVASNANTKNKKLATSTFRLPDESEWVYAAKAGKVNATYPWGRDSIQNNRHLFLANFCIQKLKEQFMQPIIYPSKSNPNSYTSAGMALCSDTIATVHVYSYNPNDYFLYCMSGNVSEMVYVVGTKTIKTKGGNWASDFEHVKIDSEDEFKAPIKPSPRIGFRVVVNAGN
ncbi:MAG TPA: SUMF1/EgtB/PvdO family nonheme iron enzyme [Bacteroidia bacterium]|jgi:hypothetical protein|nr:SUMF1/EgtB/PvdO family nonheme iron enzyme [Bacteroidia bacterium]